MKHSLSANMNSARIPWSVDSVAVCLLTLLYSNGKWSLPAVVFHLGLLSSCPTLVQFLRLILSPLQPLPSWFLTAKVRSLVHCGLSGVICCSVTLLLISPDLFQLFLPVFQPRILRLPLVGFVCLMDWSSAFPLPELSQSNFTYSAFVSSALCFQYASAR